jgi:hypothetical protein
VVDEGATGSVFLWSIRTALRVRIRQATSWSSPRKPNLIADHQA